MTSFKEEYDKIQEEDEESFEMIGRRTGIDAVNSLNEADQKEVFRLDLYSEGIFNYRNEDNTKIIALGFPSHLAVVLPCYATISDLLITRGRDYIEIRLFKVN